MDRSAPLKLISLLTLSFAVIAAGIAHFIQPEGFVAIVPDYLPNPLALVYISGFFEIAGGVGLLISKTRRLAAWGLIALFVAVFPANIHMAVHQISPGGQTIAPWILWARLPLQFLLIAWAYGFTKSVPAKAL